MKLWLLKPSHLLPDDENPWEPWYDKAFGFVVRAETEEDARNYAAEYSGDEGVPSWTNPALSTCVELTVNGNTEVILREFRSA